MIKVSTIFITVLLMLFSISMRISAMSTEPFVDYTKVDGLVYIFSVDNSIKYDGYVDLSESKLVFANGEYDSTLYRSSVVKVFVQIVVSGAAYSFIVGFIGVDIALHVGAFTRNKIYELYGYLPKYTYNYTIDNGCYSAAFPANPFC